MDHTTASKEWQTDRRNIRRLILTAAAEVTELEKGLTRIARLTDIGTGGCFLETIFPFSVESRVRVTVRKEHLTFEADGKVVYAQSRVGMGVTFDKLNRDQRSALLQLV